MIFNTIVPAFFLLYTTYFYHKHKLYDRFKKRFYFFWGGRGSGKSVQVADYIISECRQKRIRVLCTREIQKSIKSSVHALLSDRIRFMDLGTEFEILETKIKHKNGSTIEFSGLREHTVDSIKSYEGVDICWVEEAHSVSKASLDILVPTIRKDAIIEREGKIIPFDTLEDKLLKTDKFISHKSHFIFTYNRFMENDPVHVRARKALQASEKRSYKLKSKKDPLSWVEYSGTDAYGLFINAEGNPFFPAVLKKDREDDYRDDPECADHTWGGLPIGQAAFSIFTRDQVKSAVERKSDPGPYGRTYIGVDVARYGDDSTVMYKRRNNTVLEVKKYKKLSIPQVAMLALKLGDYDPEIQYNIDDTGLGGGVTDILQEQGWRVNGVNFASKSGNPEKYDSIVAEMIFNIKDRIDNMDIPDISELREELTGRTYYMTKNGKRAVESKADFKKRLGRSCDDMDAFILAFHEPNTTGSAQVLGNVL